EDTGDVGRRLYLRATDPDRIRLASKPCVTDIDIQIACRQIGSSVKTNANVGGAGGVAVKCSRANGGVVASGTRAADVAVERPISDSSVVIAVHVGKERFNSHGNVLTAVGVANQRVITGRRVLVTIPIATKCINPCRSVAIARYVVEK